MNKKLDEGLQPIKTAYNVAMNFLEEEWLKKKPDQIGSGKWKRLKDDLNFLGKKKSDRIVNWLIDNYPPQMNITVPYLNENERHAFDPDAYKLLLRSYKTRMVPERFIEDLIMRSTDFDGIHFSQEFLQNCLAKFWEDSMQEMPQPDIH